MPRYRFTMIVQLKELDGSDLFEEFEASVIATDKDAAIAKLSQVVGEPFEVDFIEFIEVEEI